MKHYKLSLLTAVTLGITIFGSTLINASSHREAPFITEVPKVDATDFYMFNSYEPGREDYITLIANYLPLQDPYGGPNYFNMDPEALYEIHIDNDGDALEDITFQFRFESILNDIKVPVGDKEVSIPLINAGSIFSGFDSSINVFEKYVVNIVRGDRRRGSRDSITNAVNDENEFLKPLDNIGDKSLPDYTAYASQFMYDVAIPGCGDGRMFVGQRKDPFVVNLGEVFDLINTNPLGAEDGETDTLADKNVTSLVLEVPKTCLTTGDEPVIGAWTTASLRQARLIKRNASFDRATLEGGAWAQVSRLSMPLVNEIVIGVKDKNRFNASKPKNDTQFLDYVTNPTLPALVELLFPSAPAPTLFPRDDLVATFLTGINTSATGNLNQPNNVVPSEMMRLNTSIPPTLTGSQNRLGVIGGDLAGFPNGRRPGDDVVDIELRVAMGALISLGLYGNIDQAPAGTAPVTDGAFLDESFFDVTFPYLREPLPGALGN